MSVRRNREPRTFTLFDALVQERVEEAGGIMSYAEKLGISHVALWRCLSDANGVFSRDTPNKQKLIDDLAFPNPALEKLASITVNDACILVLEAIENQSQSQQ